MANTLYLGGIPVVRSPDGPQREEAVRMLLQVQRTWASLGEARAAAEAYLNAKATTKAVINDIEQLRLVPGFPPGSNCELCEPFT